MNIKTISGLLIMFGLIMIFWGVGMDTTVGYGDERVNNLGLMSRQQNMLMLGGIAFLAGIILFALHKIKQTNEEKLAEQEKIKLRKKQGAEIVDTVHDTINSIWRRDDFARRLMLGIVAAGCYIFFIFVACEILFSIRADSCAIESSGCILSARDTSDRLNIILSLIIPLATIYYAFRQKTVLTITTNFLILNIALFSAASIPAAFIVEWSAEGIRPFLFFNVLPIALSCLLYWKTRKLAIQAHAMG